MKINGKVYIRIDDTERFLNDSQYYSCQKCAFWGNYDACSLVRCLTYSKNGEVVKSSYFISNQISKNSHVI